MGVDVTWLRTRRVIIGYPSDLDLHDTMRYAFLHQGCQLTLTDHLKLDNPYISSSSCGSFEGYGKCAWLECHLCRTARCVVQQRSVTARRIGAYL